MKKRIQLFVFLNLLLFSLSAQDSTLWLLNGKKIEIRNFKFHKSDSLFTFSDSKGNFYKHEYEDIFALIDSKGREKVMFIPEPDDTVFTVCGMRSYVMGQHAARNGYTNRFAYVSGFLVGGISVLALPAIGVEYYFAPVVSIAHNTIVSVLPIKKSKIPIPEEYLYDECYIKGYEAVASDRRLKNTLIGSGVGLAVGAIIAIIVNK